MYLRKIKRDEQVGFDYKEEFIRDGMSDSVVHCKQNYYFMIKDTASYLHINTLTKKTRIINNIEFLGVKDDENIVYRDYSDDNVYTYNGRRKRFIGAYPKGRTAEVKKEYILFSDSGGYFWPLWPIKLYYSGKVEKGNESEAAKSWYNHILIDNLNTSVIHLYSNILHPGILTLCEEEKIKELQNQPLTLSNLRRVFAFYTSLKKWRKGLAFTFKGVLDLLQKSGVEENEEIGTLMYTLVEYNDKCLKNGTTAFFRSFYYLLYRLAKRPDFLELLRNDPQELFKDFIVYKLEDRESLSKYRAIFSTKIGYFRVGKNGLETKVIDSTLGYVNETNEIVPYETEEKWEGKVTYFPCSRKRRFYYNKELTVKQKEALENSFSTAFFYGEHIFANEELEWCFGTE